MVSVPLFLLAVLSLLATPGPTNTLLATAGATSGVRQALPLLAAELSGYLIAISIVGFLLRPLLAGAPVIGIVLKVSVAVYLVFTAIRLWRRTTASEAEHGLVSGRSVFITTLLNPKVLIFALVILPFGHDDIAGYLAAFSICVLGVGCCWVALGGFLGLATADKYPRLVPRIASVALAGFASLIFASAFG